MADNVNQKDKCLLTETDNVTQNKAYDNDIYDRVRQKLLKK